MRKWRNHTYAYFISRGIALFGLLLLGNNAMVSAQQSFYRKPSTNIVDSLPKKYGEFQIAYGKNKTIPLALQEQCIYALSFFPELSESRIVFRIKKSKGGIISTRPTIWSVFRRSSRRKYLVIINDSTEGRVLPVFMNAPVNGQVGILGHELNHIVYFSRRTGLGLIGLGIMHISRKYIDRFEYKTDQQTIARGLGHQLYSWKQYLDTQFKKMKKFNSASGEADKMKNRYMSLAQINEEIEKSDIYR